MTVEELNRQWCSQTRKYKGVTVVRTGIMWTVWIDFVHPACHQPVFSSLALARAAISAVIP